MMNFRYPYRIFLFLSAAVIFTAVIFSGCMTAEGGLDIGKNKPPEDARLLWDLDAYPANVYMGVSAPYYDVDTMVEKALYRCSRNIAIGKLAAVSSSLVSESSSSQGLISFASDAEALYLEDEIESILSRLELLEVRGNSRTGIIVIAADPAVPADPRPYTQDFGEDGRPTWVDSVPDIPGYITAVGESLEYQFLRDSMEAADFTAAEAIINKSPRAVTKARSYAVNATFETENTHFEHFQEGILQVAEGTLEGFYVLARWYDPDENHFYSLAVVPED